MSPDPLREAITLATAAAETGGGPFGAVVVHDGHHYAATNSVTLITDPTAHAEVQAIRLAAASIGSHDLTGAVLYTSTYPCPMCYSAALWAGIEKVFYAASPTDAAAAGFDDAKFWRAVQATALSPMRVVQDPRHDRLNPFEAWEKNPDRIPY